ncbi:MAG: hypothetical protein ACW99G_10215 [Candidatus Thorarchaeota archaeon]|jgi:hypothetical protein
MTIGMFMILSTYAFCIALWLSIRIARRFEEKREAIPYEMIWMDIVNGSGVVLGQVQVWPEEDFLR